MEGYGGAKDKWVCPNDRQLALRARLKAGWCVKANSINSFGKPEHLNEKEQEVIIKVIKRAENLEKIEQERVGRLVERLENMRKNAMGNGTTQCILCADEFGILSPSPLSCHDCKKAVCTKCGVDTVSAHKEPLWLCKICAETRETWKKSGAWFYKGLPKYILPARKNEQSKCARGPPVFAEQHASPVRSYNSWLQSKGRSSSDKEFTDSSDDELRTGKLHRKPANQQSFHNSIDSADFIGNTNRSQNLPKAFSNATSPHHVIPKTSNQDPTFEDGAFSEITAGRTNPSAVSQWYKNRRTVEDEVDVDKRHSLRQEPPVPIRRNLDNGKPPRLEPAPQDPRFEEMPPENASTLEYSVIYDPHSESLNCTIYRAKALVTSGYDGLADPFVRLQLLPRQDKADKVRTRTVHKTLNPEFNETVSFFGLTDYDISKRILRLTIVDEDPFGNHPMAETKIPLKIIRPLQAKHFHVYLNKPSEVDSDSDDQTRGQILISLVYSSERRTLVVGIVRCVDLPARENCDPYVRIHLKPDPLRRRHKTATKKRTLSPEYRQEFHFEMKPHELNQKTLAISVWGKDSGRSDEYIGGVALGMQAKGDRLSHWLDVMRNPDRRIERWHPLSHAVAMD